MSRFVGADFRLCHSTQGCPSKRLLHRRRRGTYVLRWRSFKSGEMATYLGEAADEPALSAGAVLAVLAVVEGARVADGHVVQADVELRLDAAPQAVAAAGELNTRRGGGWREKHQV